MEVQPRVAYRAGHEAKCTMVMNKKLISRLLMMVNKKYVHDKGIGGTRPDAKPSLSPSGLA